MEQLQPSPEGRWRKIKDQYLITPWLLLLMPPATYLLPTGYMIKYARSARTVRLRLLPAAVVLAQKTGKAWQLHFICLKALLQMIKATYMYRILITILSVR